MPPPDSQYPDANQVRADPDNVGTHRLHWRASQSDRPHHSCQTNADQKPELDDMDVATHEDGKDPCRSYSAIPETLARLVLSREGETERRPWSEQYVRGFCSGAS